MKRASLCTALLFTGLACVAQSKSYQTLRKQFSGDGNVFSLHTSGFLARAVLSIAGEHDLNDAIRDVRNIHLLVIPREAFRAASLTLADFLEDAGKDGFEELLHARKRGDNVTLLAKMGAGRNEHRYMLLVDNDHDVVAMEIKGYIDPNLLKNDDLAELNP